VLASTTIHVAAGPSAGPSRVAIVEVGGRRHLVRLAIEDGPEDELPGRRVQLFVGSDGLLDARLGPAPVFVRWLKGRLPERGRS
jgi:hypothetical protein